MIKKIGVLGTGTMGAGIIQVLAQNGYDVVLRARRETSVANGLATVTKNLERLVAKEKISVEEKDAALAHVKGDTNIEIVKDADLIIEAATEDLEAKKALFAELQGICRPDAIFATNTSSLSVTELSAGLDRPVVGMHFFNPAPVMKLVEVVTGLATPPELVEKVKTIAASIDKTPVEVKDSAGFVVNRILVPMINEAVGVLAEGTACAGDIDIAMKLGANHPMGPLALGDLIGLDICLAIMEVLYSESGDPKYRPHPLLRKMVRGRLLGRKTGRGFFEYGKS